MIYVFSGIGTLVRTKRMNALYKVNISTNTIDITILGMIYTTA
jgi:hypothetical protein